MSDRTCNGTHIVYQVPGLVCLLSIPCLLRQCLLDRLHYRDAEILLVVTKLFDLIQIRSEGLFINDGVVFLAIVEAAQPRANDSRLANLAMYVLIARDFRRVDRYLRLS